MIIIGLVFIFSMYVAAFIGKVFKLSDNTTGSLILWCFLFSMCGLFYSLSLPTTQVFH